MVRKRTTNDYLKGNLEKIGPTIDGYLAFLEKQDRGRNAVRDTRSNLHSFFMRTPTVIPSAEQFENVRKEMISDGISEKNIRARLYAAGEFYEHCYGVNPYRENEDVICKVWWGIPETEFQFPEELKEYVDYLSKDGLGKTSLSRAGFYVTKCCQILRYEGKIREIVDIGPECFRLLATKYLGKTNVKTVERIFVALNGFVFYFTGRTPLAEYRSELRVRSEMESTPQWKAMEALKKEYLEDQIDRGLTRQSVRSTGGNLGTILKRLFVICGPLYPNEVTKHHFREVRRNCPDIKDTTLKTYLCKLGGMIKFGTGNDPYNEAAMLWSRTDIERTWIFKDQWKRMLAVANPTEKMILYLGAGLGLRREEIATIKLSDFKGNKVMVNGKGHGRGKLVEKEVPQSVLRAIEEYLPYREETIAQHGDRANGALIAIPYRTHSPTASIRFVEQSMRDLEEKSKIKATCHTLRRFYCTNLFDAGVEQDTVRRMMRHSHLDTTLNHYLYADPRKIRGATTAVDDALDL